MSPCYRCLYPEPPPPGLVPSCAEGGVLGVLPGVIGVIQATEAIKLLTGIGEPLIGRFLLCGVVLLAAGLSLSPMLLKQAQSANPLADPKVLWSGFVLLLYVGNFIHLF